MTTIFDHRILHLTQVEWRVMEGRFCYDISDHEDHVVATVREPKQAVWKTFFLSFTSQAYKIKHFMHVDGPNGEPLFAVEKQNELRGSVAHLMLPETGVIGSVKRVNHVQKVHPHFRIKDENKNLVADVRSAGGRLFDYHWNYGITDPGGVEIARILRADDNPPAGTPDLRGDYTLQVEATLPESVRKLLVAAFVAIVWFSDEAMAR